MPPAAILLASTLAGAASCGPKPTLEEVLQDFEVESGAEFTDCGIGRVACVAGQARDPNEDFDEPRTCSIDAGAPPTSSPAQAARDDAHPPRPFAARSVFNCAAHVLAARCGG
jgi:hypothetical protein